MVRKGLWIAAVVVTVSNAYTLGSARSNRTAEPEAVLDLTERELHLAPREADNTAIVLRVEWTDLQPRFPAEAGPGWFDQAKLASIGFDTSLPVTPENGPRYNGMPPRAVYAALENDGEAWRRHLDAVATPAEKDAASRRPRLVLIDVGTDAGALRARYPDRRRTVIVPATAGLTFVQPRTGRPFLKGRVNTVYPMELNVPKELRPLLESLSPRPMVATLPRGEGQADAVLRQGDLALAGEPRYRVTVKWGRSLEPWIESVERMK